MSDTPTIKQINAAHEVIRPFSESLYSVLAPIFAAARRGVEADHELQNAFEDAITRAERAEAELAAAVANEREACAVACENIGKDIVCPEECAEAIRARAEQGEKS